jgi:hypothetical protein
MELNGVPLHPLVVHAVVVLGPLAALTGVAYAAVPRWRWLLRWPLVALAAVVAVVAWVAVAAGEDLLAARPELGPIVAEHHDYGETLRLWAVGFLAASALAAWSMGGPSALASGRGASESVAKVGIAAGVVLVVASVGLVVYVYLAGDSGATAVWG